MSELLPAAAASLALALVATPLAGALARRLGWVALPRGDRWHREPVALLGGLALLVAYVLPLALLAGRDPLAWVLIAASIGLAALGLYDDRVGLAPSSKLLGQLAAAALVITSGMLLGAVALPWLAGLLTLVWIVAVANALNLLDNMDGLAGGVAAIAAAALAAAGLLLESPLMALAAACLAGASLGFLAFNLPPARIFMGDAGSLVLGFNLAAIASLGAWESGGRSALVMLVPVLVMAVPIFDTLFVSIARLAAGRPLAKGGTDHTSHQLVSLGLSERGAVGVLHAAAAGCGALGLYALHSGRLYPALAALLAVVVLAWLLALVVARRGAAQRAEQGPPGHTLLRRLPLAREGLPALAADTVVLALAFPLAFAIRFDGIPAAYGALIARSLPALLAVQLAALAGFGLYRGRVAPPAGRALVELAKATTAAALLSVVVATMLFRFEDFSRAVFAIDWMLALLGASGWRIAASLRPASASAGPESTPSGEERARGPRHPHSS